MGGPDNPPPVITAFPHVKPWSSVTRNVRLGHNRSTDTWVQAVSQTLLTPSETAVLSVIASNTEHRTWDGFRWSIDHLRKWAGVSRATVEKALRRLRALLLIRQDGSIKTNHQADDQRRDVVVYRLAGIPDHPLPVHVERARDPESAVWTDDDQNAVTCKFTYTPEQHPASPRTHQTPDTCTPDLSRPDVVEDRYVGQRADAERETIIPADITTRLTRTQRRRLAAIAAETLTRDGISPARLAARVRRWWTATGGRIRSAFGWCWHAIERRHYGCADPRCEDGDLWDGDRITGRCAGCTERRRDRAAVVRAGQVPTAPYTAPWTPAWVSDRTDAHRALTAFLAAPVVYAT
jgi:hypothetical protein